MRRYTEPYWSVNDGVGTSGDTMSGTQLLGSVEHGFNQGLKTVSEGWVVEVTFVVERLLDMTHRQLFGHGPTVKLTESDPHVVECVGVGDPAEG